MSGDSKTLAPFKVQWERYVLRQAKLKPASALVALAWIAYANPNGTFEVNGRSYRPGMAKLSDDLGVSMSTVQRGFRELEAAGLVQSRKRGYPGSATDWEPFLPDPSPVSGDLCSDVSLPASPVSGDLCSSEEHRSVVTCVESDHRSNEAASPVNSEGLTGQTEPEHRSVVTCIQDVPTQVSQDLPTQPSPKGYGSWARAAASAATPDSAALEVLMEQAPSFDD